MTQSYDAIVVGARCAGAPTATLLARKGYEVLMVDRATFPSDTVSTHFVHAPGVAALERWGMREPLASSGCPPIRNYSFDFGVRPAMWVLGAGLAVTCAAEVSRHLRPRRVGRRQPATA